MKNALLYLYIGLAFLLLLSFYLWRFSSSKEFGLNLLTEVVGIAITVFFIEKIIDKSKRNERRPITAAAYNDIRLLVNRYIGFFQELYRHSVNEPEPPTLEAFLKLETADKIWDNLNMNGKPNVFPEIDMWTYLQNTAKNFHELGTKVLDRYGGSLEPSIYKYVHNLTESNLITYWKDNLVSLRYIDINNNYPRPKILSAYSIRPSSEDFDSVLNLYYWCQKVQKNLGREFDLPHLLDYNIIGEDKRKLSMRKDPIELENEIQVWNKFQGK
jgi:hypothetical protein